MKRMLTLTLLLAAVTAAAQPLPGAGHAAVPSGAVSPAVAPLRFDALLRRNPWNASENAAGIRQDSVSRSYAEAYFTKENGGMADFSASDDSWNAGARTRSIRHFRKVSFAGGFGYDYFDGSNMSGSIFTELGHYPVDIVEFTPGRKIRETYAFDAAVAAVLGERWTGGLKARFKARNYSKRKDLRHKNTRLDFEFSPGVMYRAGRFAAGAAYIVGINTEKVEGEVVGPNSDAYDAFFDRGLRFGSLQWWESGDLHLTTSGVSGFPVRESVQGAAVGLQGGPLYVDAAYRRKRGETGERSIIWHEFDADCLSADAVLSLGRAASRHFVRLALAWESLDNRENLLTYENVNGVNEVRYHGQLPVFGRRSLSVKGEYEWQTARTELRAGAERSQLRRQSTLMFPYVEGQKLHYTGVWASCLQRFGAWELSLGAEFRKGGFRESETRFDAEGTPGEYPVRLTACYDWENEYLTAARLGASAGLRRRFGGLYADLSARYEHGFGLKVIDRADRVRATLAIGYNF